MLMKNATLAITTAALAGLATSASAQVIAADSFVTDEGAGTYVDNSGLNGQNATVGTTGFSTAWSVGSANLQPDTITLTQPPTTDQYATGGKGSYIGSSFNAFRRGFRAVDSYTPVADGGDYWMSFLVNSGGQFVAGGRTDGYALVGYTNFFNQAAFENQAGSANAFGLQVGYKGNGGGAAGDFDLIVRARDGSGDLTDFVLDDTPVAGATNLIVLKVSAGAGADVVDYWVDPGDASSEVALDLTAASSGTLNTFAFNTPSDVDRLNVLTTNWSRGFFYDEARFAYDLAGAVPVPEPTTAGVALIAAGGLLARRRRA